MTKTDLDYWWGGPDAGNWTKYSTVALFDLEKDPSESVNIAYDNRELVQILLEEAEEAIKDAPRQIRGDVSLIHFTANKFSLLTKCVISSFWINKPSEMELLAFGTT